MTFIDFLATCRARLDGVVATIKKTHHELTFHSFASVVAAVYGEPIGPKTKTQLGEEIRLLADAYGLEVTDSEVNELVQELMPHG